jgi:hypothetical protein
MDEENNIILCARDLLQRGTFAKIAISYWHGALPPKLVAEISDNPEWKSRIVAPSNYQQAFRRIMFKRKRLIHLYAYPTLWGKFVPETAKVSWDDQCVALKEEFELGRDYLIANYEALRAKTLVIGREIGQIDWRRLYPQSGAPPESFLIEWGEKVWESMPKKSELYNRFKYNVFNYRLAELVQWEPEEAEHFLTDIAVEFRRRINILCSEILNEKRRYGKFRISTSELLIGRVQKLKLMHFFGNVEVDLWLTRLADATQHPPTCDCNRIADIAKELMAYVVPRFSSESISGILEGYKVRV